jgi:hypothetical protein
MRGSTNTATGFAYHQSHPPQQHEQGSASATCVRLGEWARGAPSCRLHLAYDRHTAHTVLKLRSALARASRAH